MLRVGLTGGIASGKSFVADRLAELGAVVIDADVLAREVVAPGTSGLAEIVVEFGADVLTPDGSLDRSAMAARIFEDDDVRRRLEAIIHPRVRDAARRLEAATVDADESAVVVHVIPLLVETGQAEAYDVVVVVDVDPQTQLDRLVRLRGMSERDAQRRIAAQATSEQRLAAADEVIHNNGSLEELTAQAATLWRRLTQNDHVH